MWRYSQSTGILTNDKGETRATGYSGCGDAKNRPECQDRKCEGPIPQGKWMIIALFDSSEHGPYVLRLAPEDPNSTFGREGFLIHGDSVKFPGEASRGCIIFPRRVREEIWTSEDIELEVTA
jgi:hypothetical protein